MKKALVISYYWPPAGGPGVQRIINIVKHLSSTGWEPVLLTVEDPSAPARDKSLLTQIPPNLKIYKTKTSEPFSAYKKFTGKKPNDVISKSVSTSSKKTFKEKLSLWIRANAFIPDARKGWIPHLVRQGIKIIETEQPDIIFSTSPPHSLQLGAMKLAQKTGLPWVLDLRDPWTEAYWETQMPKTDFSKKRNRDFERRALRSADAITTVGDGVKKILKTKTDKPVHVIYNGYRDVDHRIIPSDKFEIVHIGNVSKTQSFDSLLDALSLIGEDIRKEVQLKFIGNVDIIHKQKTQEYKKLDIEFHDFKPYNEMMEQARSAALFLIPRLHSTYSKGLITAKLFDYLALSRPILALSEKGSDIDRILSKSQTGRSFESDDIAGIGNYITEQFNYWKQQGCPTIVKNENINQFSTENNIEKLSKIFNDLTKPDK